MKFFARTLWIMVLITLVLWLLSKSSLDLLILNPIKSLTQLFALLGATGYFTSYILSSRLPFFEKAIPLDKTYKLHRIVGTLAGTGILLHVSTLISNLLPSPNALSLYLLPSSNLSYTMGVLAFYFLLITLVTSLYMKLPYNVWKFVHQITSYSIILAALHLYLIPSDISAYLPLRIWMLGLVCLSLLAWFFRQFIYTKLEFSHKYTVSDVTTLDGISIVTLTATQNPLMLEPGQFAFFKVDSPNSKVSSEVHPFTVLSASKDSLMIGIKAVGDFTATIAMLKKGTTIRMAGPHGSFGKEIVQGTTPQVWIAGGIGVTPFFNIAAYLSSKKLRKDIKFFYTTTEQDRLFHPFLLDYTNSVGIDYRYTCSNTVGRITPENTLTELKQPLKSYAYFLCGPKSLLVSFINYLEKAGVSREQIYTEDFDFKALEI